MINKRLQPFFNTAKYTSRIDQVKASFLYTVLASLLVAMTGIGVFGVMSGDIASPLIPVIVIAVLFLVYGLVRAGQLSAANWTLILALVSVLLVNNVIDGSIGALTLVINVTLILMAGFLVDTPGIILMVVISTIQLFVFADVRGIPESFLAGRLPLIFVYMITGFIVYVYNQLLRANRMEGQDLESVERLKLAEINAQITRQASARESLDTALNSTLQLILDNYPEIYHAQVFLLDDEGIQAKLVASTGEAGQKLMERAHSLAVGSLSVIGQTTFKGDPVVAISGSGDSVHRANELLPDTKLEAAFPLRVGNQIIGALDLQSTVLEQLDDNDRLTFQSLANSLSLAIDSIRQFEQAQTRVEENQRLAEQTRSALREVERLNQRLIGRAWSEYAKGLDENLGYAVDFEQGHTTTYHEWSNTLAEAVKFNNLVQEGNVIAVPLRVRGQIIGAMEFELDGSQDFSPEDLELITEVSERFGLAAENTRLVEESQRTAQRETLINQITSRFQSAQNVEATLAEAARSLSETLNADNIKIRLGVPDNANGKGS